MTFTLPGKAAGREQDWGGNL